MSVGGRRGITASAVTGELAALAGAIALAVLVLARVASTARGTLLFTDGDSMLPVLFVRSLDAGDGQDWAMSSVLFVPELALFNAIWKLGFGVDWTIAINGVVNLTALYVALRCVAGGWFRSLAGLVGASAAFGTFAVLAMLDHSPNRESLELASLMTTPTYYSATVIALVLSIALLRAVFVSRDRTRVLWATLLGVVATLSVMSNPLYLLWVTGPLGVILAAVGVRTHRCVAWMAAAVLAAASLAGYALRLPFAPHIANDGLAYIDIGAAGASVVYYVGLAGAMFASVGGATSVLAATGLMVFSFWLSRRAWRERDVPSALVAGAGWAVPVLVIAAAVLLGTHAARYLQPVVFAPLVGVVIAPTLTRMPRAGPVRAAVVTAIASASLLVASFLIAPALVSAINRPDRDLACLTSWVDRSGRTGAGQYWSVRLPKAHIEDPRRLVQVDALMQPYDWLVDRSDASVRAVSFLVVDANSEPYVLETRRNPRLVGCGRYQILDFGTPVLALGVPHS